MNTDDLNKSIKLISKFLLYNEYDPKLDWESKKELRLIIVDIFEVYFKLFKKEIGIKDSNSE